MGKREERERSQVGHRRGHREIHTESRLIELQRRKFVINRSLTTLAVSLLICTSMILEVRADSQPSFRKVFSTEPLGDPNAQAQHNSPEHGSIASVATSASSSAPSTTGAPTSPVGGRQPRATTRRRSTSSSSTSTTASSASISSTASPALTEAETTITSAPRPLIGVRAMRAPNKKLRPEEEAVQDEADAAAEAEEAERAAARRRRLRRRKKLTSAPSSPVSTPTDLLTTTTDKPLPSTSSTARAPTSRRPSATSSRVADANSGELPPSTTRKGASATSALGGRHVAGNHLHHTDFNSSDDGLGLHDARTVDDTDDLDYDDESTASSKAPASTTTGRKTLDLDKVKLVDAAHHNGTHWSGQSLAQDGRHANGTNSTTDGALEPVRPHDEHEPAEPLGARSPGVSKRLSDMIAETRGRLRSSSTPAPGSSTRHFSYAKPTSTTETPPSPPTTLVATTPSPPPSGLIVQVMNQTAAGEPTGRLVTLNETAAHLDWSKLVKVMFKSARDNQTVYTLVMNSSELSGHPISDWSNELPGLLRRDFEKLKRKWLHVFPDLMTDLATIITSKHPINGTLKPSSEADPTRLPSLKLVPSTTPAFYANASTTVAPQSTSPMSSSASNRTIAANATQAAQAATFTPLASNSTTNSSTSAIQTTSPAPVAVDDATLAGQLQDISNSSAVVQSRQPIGNSTSVDGYGRTSLNQAATNKIQTSTEGLIKVRGVNGTQTRSAEAGVDRNKTMDEMIQDIRDENMKIEDDVREQGSSLKHFIIICSISTVVATSLVVALILLLLK